MGPASWHQGQLLGENGNSTGVALLKTPILHALSFGKGCDRLLAAVISGAI
ncbi:hypothetical protein NG796_00835 [Laspinema sp. A4]|uniref:hypothetical protein n=1 Tax=Laspinema sp. D2d TaxID=2953686 RepID=UPI0021BAF088|nr:hypothetical protein [Laspinema sp. D2d]MCT7981830.1 hypothetical protein [Laspinema sp. D2d]